MRTLYSAMLICSSMPLVAQGAIDFNAGLANDYVFRGYSFAETGVVVQASVDAEFDSGIYTGLWVTNTVKPGGELNLYLGYSASIFEALDINVNYVRYQYPSTQDETAGSDEFSIGVSYSNISFIVHHDTTMNTQYIESIFYNDISDTMSLTLHAGKVIKGENHISDYSAQMDYKLSESVTVFVMGTKTSDKTEGTHIVIGVNYSL